MPNPVDPAAAASVGDVVARIGADIDRGFLPALADASYVIAAHSVHPAEEEFKGAVIVKLRLEAADAAIGVHVYPKMDRPCFAQTGHFNVCFDSRGNCSSKEQALLRRFIERLRTWEEGSRNDADSRALLDLLRQPLVETRR